MTPKSLGQLAYEADCAARPYYDDHSERKTWAQLDQIARLSWERNPTPRPWRYLTVTTEETFNRIA